MEQVTKFSELPLVEQLQKNLARSGFTTPTPIQAQAIRPALDGKDLMGIAQTGTGKTLAFGLPMLQAFLTKQTKGLVIVPTRELALQVYESLTKISGGYIKLAVLIGGLVKLLLLVYQCYKPF
jgi:ATP-dependent RNA helicase RhlE